MTRVKICGLTNLEDATVAAEAGADMLGFIFHEKSPRYVTRETVTTITEALRGLDIDRMPLFVGVFVSPTADDVAETLEQCWLQAAQVHKMDMPTLQQMIRRTHCTYPVFQAGPMETKQVTDNFGGLLKDITEIASGPTNMVLTDQHIAPWLPTILIDAYHPTLAGGTGQTVNLPFAKMMAEFLVSRRGRMMLAGGLTPDNVAETIRAVRPWAVDVSSGVESTPGKKDHGKVRAFIQAVREVDRQLSNKD